VFVATDDEASRVEALRALNLLGTPPERCFDQIALLAQAAAGAPVAMVSFIGEEKQWFKAKVGMALRQNRLHRSAFGLQVLREEELLWVEDASRDERFFDNPLVCGRPWIRFYAGAPIRLDTGEAIGSVAVIAAKPRPFDKALARQLRGLADLAGDECTLRASLKALNAARSEAESARKVKSAFLTNMNHELRTPMNGVIAAAEMLRDGPLTADQRELVEIVAGSAQNLCAVLDDVLELSNHAAEGAQCPVTAFNAAEVGRQALGFYDGAARSKGLRVIVEVDTVDRLFVGQPASLRQILRALISNAVKFTHTGHVALRAEMHPAGRRRKLVFTVEDTGVGFEPEVQTRLFEPFEMGDGSLTRRHGGLGAGLAIARALTDRVGGRLEAESKSGRGSSFRLTLRLPLAKADQVSRGVTGPIGRCGARTPRALVAEDHPTNRRVLQLILGAAGIEAEFVENGALAVEVMGRRAFDIVLMDMQMPVMDGLTAIEQIRRLQAERGDPITPICTLTAHAMPEHQDAAFKSGAQAHLTKPVAAAELLECVARLTGWTP
jgi:signal transduction histidine kinase